MMRHVLPVILAAGFSVGVAGPAGADPRAPLGEALASAAQVRLEALDIRRQLRERQPDLLGVMQRLSILQERVNALQSSMGEIDIDRMVLVPEDRDALERARAAGDALAALLQNKTALLSDPGRADRQRRLIRAKAHGIAVRARIIEDQLEMVLGF